MDKPSGVARIQIKRESHREFRDHSKMSVLLFGCFLFSFLSVSLGRGESQIAFAPYHHHAGPSFSRLNSLLRLFSMMHQLTGSVNPSPYGHLERGNIPLCKIE